MNNTHDQFLVERAKIGHHESYGELAKRYQGVMLAIAYSRLGNLSVSEDIAQEALVVGFEKLKTLRRPQHFGLWLAAIARNLCKHWLRDQSYRKRLVEDSQALREKLGLHQVDNPLSALEQEESANLLRAALNSLPVSDRELVVMFYFQNKSVESLAKAVGISEPATRKRLQRARARLRDTLAASLEETLGNAAQESKISSRVMAAIPVGATFSKLTNSYSVIPTSAGLLFSASLMRAGLTTRAARGIAVAGTGAAIVAGFFAWSYFAPALARKSRSENVASDSAVATTSFEQPVKDHVASRPLALQPNGTQSLPTKLSSTDQEKTSLEKSDDLNKQEDKQKAILTALEAPCNIEFDDQEIDRVLAFISNFMKIRFELDSTALAPAPDSEIQKNFVTNGMVAHIEAEEVPISTILADVLAPLSLDCVIEPGFVWISTSEKIREETSREPDERYDKYDLESKLAEYASIESENTHLQNILNDINRDRQNRAGHINFVVDYRVVRPPADASMSNSTVVAINVGNLEFRDAFKALMRPLNLSYSVEDDFIWVSTPDHIRDGYQAHAGSSLILGNG